ncbi:Alpha/Beta hydrolase protein [Baffinella frigidus]|nr:Alpha/Beta hydrolase protein [Cryptophyta sp. CCMP2293]
MVDVMADLVCRPPRRIYEMEELGPSQFLLDNQFCVREDFELTNSDKREIACSFYFAADRKTGQAVACSPCVVYLHGNSGCRLEGDELADSFLKRGVSFFSMDFCGCGLSSGNIVTLGHSERRDVEVVLDFLKENAAVSFIALYGRSMGAATALLVAADDRYYHCISGLVIDSCYTSVRQVLEDLSNTYVGQNQLLSSMGVGPAIELLRAAVKAKASFDIDSVDILAAAPHCQAPVLIAHTRNDKLVNVAHSHRIWEEYGGDKQLSVFDGDHNSARPEEFRQHARDFLVDCFQKEEEAAQGSTPGWRLARARVERRHGRVGLVGRAWEEWQGGSLGPVLATLLHSKSKSAVVILACLVATLAVACQQIRGWVSAAYVYGEEID